MPESAKECARPLAEGSDIGLGPGDRAFEPHYSDQNPSEIVDFRGIFLILCLLRRKRLRYVISVLSEPLIFGLKLV